MKKNPIVTFTMKDGKVIKAELYPEKAPNTVNNFISLVRHQFYDGLTFHRVIEGFMIQGGDPAGNGTGGPGYTIKGEFQSNGFASNDIKHLRGGTVDAPRLRRLAIFYHAPKRGAFGRAVRRVRQSD